MYQINLNELTFESIAQWSTRAKISLVFGLGLFIIVLGYCLFIRQNWSLYVRTKAEEPALKINFENKQRIGVHLTEYRHQVTAINEHFSEIIKQLPEQNEMAALLEEISKAGLASGLKFELFAPQPEVVHDFYVEMPIKISVQGSYVQLAGFLSTLAEMNRIVTVQEWFIEILYFKDESVVPENEARMTSTVRLYHYRKS